MSLEVEIVAERLSVHQRYNEVCHVTSSLVFHMILLSTCSMTS